MSFFSLNRHIKSFLISNTKHNEEHVNQAFKNRQQCPLIELIFFDFLIMLVLIHPLIEIRIATICRHKNIH